MKNEIIVNGVTYVRKDNQKKQSKRGENNWYIGTKGDIIEDKFPIKEIEKPFCYPTEADCIKARDKMLALYRIKEYAEEKWGEFIPDWDNHDQHKYFIYYDHQWNRYVSEYNYYINTLLSLYLARLEHCEEIIKKFKDDLDILFDISS